MEILKKSIPISGNIPCVIEEKTPPRRENIAPVKTLTFLLLLVPLWRKNPRPVPINVQASRLITNDAKCINSY